MWYSVLTVAPKSNDNAPDVSLTDCGSAIFPSVHGTTTLPSLPVWPDVDASVPPPPVTANATDCPATPLP